MHRQGSDPDNIQPGDILCDFCERPTWEMDIPSIEGHHGSVFCVECIEQAWDRLVVEKEEIPSDPDWTCSMCLESNDGPWWQSSIREARVCRRCVKQSAGVLHKSKDWDWKKPGRED